MTQRRMLTIGSSIVFLAGCSDSTAPVPANTGLGLEPVTSRVILGSPDSELRDLPAVRVYRPSDRTGVAGRRVVFTLETPDALKTTVDVSTDSDGVAKLPAWRLGRAAGRYVATAITDGWGPIPFMVVVPGAVVAVYDLKAIGGHPVPSSDGLVTEGHYVMYEGGMFKAFYNTGVQEFAFSGAVLGVYARTDGNRIDFMSEYLNPGAASLFVSAGYGILAGREMILQRGHPMDFEPELFVLR